MMRTPGPIQQAMEKALREAFSPTMLEVRNESYLHSVPPGSESHFKVLVVSPVFERCSRIERHRRVHDCLAAVRRQGVHALSVLAWTPESWERRGWHLPASPPCLGGDGTAAKMMMMKAAVGADS